MGFQTFWRLFFT